MGRHPHNPTKARSFRQGSAVVAQASHIERDGVGRSHASLFQNGGLGAIGRELAVLAGFALVFLVLAAVRLRRGITA